VLTDGLNLTQDQLNAIAASIQATQEAEVPAGECFSGTCYPQDFLVGDVILTTAPNLQSSGIMGSLTDKDGNTWALDADQPCQTNAGDWWWGALNLNGTQFYCGYFIAIRLLNDGEVWVEEAKQGGWWSLTQAQETGNWPDVNGIRPGLGPDPGPGPNNVGGSGSGSSGGSCTSTSSSGSGSSSGSTSSGATSSGGSSGGTTAGGSSGTGTAAGGGSSGGVTTTAGVCGSANGSKVSSAPTTNLCSAGTPTAVTADGSSWIWQCAGTNGGNAGGCMASNGTAASGGDTGGEITVEGGQLMQNGAPLLLKGLSFLDSMIGDVSPQQIRALFPNSNFISLSVGADGNGYATAVPNSVIVPWVETANLNGFIVMISDYVPGQPTVRTGGDLQNSLNWYASLASAFAGNPMVVWTTENEVTDDGAGGISAMHTGIYNAIRNAGNSGVIFMEVQDGNANSPTSALSASTYASMTNVGWNGHWYPWEFPTGSGSQATFDQTGLGFISALQGFATSADGTMPYLMGEGGNSTGGGTVDDAVINGKFATVQAFIDDTGVSGGLCGYGAWIYNFDNQGGDADEMVDTSNNTLTDYGVQVANAP
jgi:Cellulase (glycosyl hydrolase family 5)